ncbi:thioredoxin-disulfide reductase [Borrelia miyamotoi]|uniref:Thioredoxin reductase n=1 Tax=Borrelia miyamotoi TaxID=47466 RepID=A0AAQ3AGV2_9SPIR|nr:thioredoxin-disulfide reductase [Borrelia miyamotoi]AGT27474.1 thioredoxin reductase [Borrelia miyamotoi LB-2001]AJA58658.1 thioredoxin reductase [Borrelia miyamotoi]AOW95740.1 thioredoxin-disulfide reductase [Borrelia miyamotoi]QTL83624.1 thioredoxin-disulfide reductase [Borrelia miyamotoi]WAZ85075.1 thioredoxin-disulfide reductase [Borrelia miyamotoi]
MLEFESLDIKKSNKKIIRTELNSVKDVIIVGSGPAGITAGIYAVMSGYKTVILEGPEPGGQLTTTTKVYNYPGFKNGVSGRELMSNMRDQVINLGATTYLEIVSGIEKRNNIFYLFTDNYVYKSKAVIIAAGSVPKKLDTLKNSDLFWNKGISVCAICDGHLFKGKTVAVIGGGNTAILEAIYLSKLLEKVYVIVRKDYLKAIAMLKEDVKKLYNVEILYNCEAIEVNGNNFVSSIQIVNNKDNSVFKLSIDGVFIAIGYKPNTEFLKGFLELDEDGYILTKDLVKTSVEGVFSCGDVSNKFYAQAITAAAEGFLASVELRNFLQ